MSDESRKPVWAAFPLIPWGSIGWRMGPGEVYWHAWVGWFRALAPGAQASYQGEWPEPGDWTGFYAMILHGTAPPWLHAQRARDEEQKPPDADEHLIDAPDKVRWMARVYLEKTNARGDGDGRIYVDPNGQFWKLGEAPAGERIGPFLWFERFSGNVIGPDNTRDSVRTARGAAVGMPRSGDA